MPTPEQLVAALLIAGLVGAGAFLAAWSSYRSMSSYIRWHPQRLATLVEEYKNIHGAYPTTLRDALVAEPVAADKDVWDHPYHYRVEGNTFRVESYGRDGRPGGEGFDSDATQDTAEPFVPTLRQFLWDENALWRDRRDAMRRVCWATTITTFAVTLLIVTQQRGEQRSGTLRTVGCIASTMLAALAIAAVHTAMLTSGH
jgi:hypothetical protein